MTTSRHEIARELGIAIRKDLQVARGSKDFAEEVRDHVKLEWLMAEPHPYETEDFYESIHEEKKLNHHGLPHWWVGTYDPKAPFLEYGTGPDKPGSQSPWGPDTPTPEFAIFAKTAHHYRGTAP